MKTIRHLLLIGLICLGTSLGLSPNPSYADVRVEKKLTQFGGPETRSRCINSLKTKGLPSCGISHWKTTCHDNWIITCSEWATDFMQHEIFLVASGPDAPNAVRDALNKALEHAMAAAIAAAAGTPGEVSVKVAAAVTAFKITLAADLAVEPLLSSMKDRYNLSLRTASHW